MTFSDKYAEFFELLSEDPKLKEKHKNIRYVIMEGGRASGKSFALSSWTNAASYKKGWGFLFTRFTMTSAHLSIIPEFRNMCDTLGNENDFQFTATEVNNIASGTSISYRGLKPSSKTANSALKSIANKNILIVEEFEEVTDQPLFEKVDLSIRTKDHKNLVIIVLNPTHINHFLYKEFIQEKRDDTLYIRTSYLDNYDNLDASFIRNAERARNRDLKKYNHIFMGEWTRDTDGALWKDCDISPYRITHDEFKALDIEEIIVSYDPAVTDSEKIDKDKTKNTGHEPDEDGIIIAARCRKKHYYILRDRTRRGTRLEIATMIADLYNEYDANFVIIEKNNGGDFIPALIKTVDKYVRCKTVTATKGKKLRAQPVQAMYENGEVHHVGHLPELELEMTSWVDGEGMASPNRLDALVWAATHLRAKRQLIIV